MFKIVLIGPAYPYRGGIAHHTNRLAEALVQFGHTVKIYTFSRQYPHFLYPGKNQLEPSGTPNPFGDLLNISINRILDTINPFSWYHTVQAIIKQNPDYCIIKYWHPYFVPCFAFIAWMLQRKKISVVCIIDNLFPHERHFGDTLLTKFFFTQISGAITQSEIVHEQFQASFTHIPETIIPHPVYDQFGPPVGKKEAQKILHIPPDKKVLLFFGFIRPYKGLDILLGIMPQLVTKYPNIHLIIAGECFGSFEIYQKLIDHLDLSKYITLHLKYIFNSDIPNYFGACDLLVMPYRSITNSGIENIGHMYALHSLLTVGLTGDKLLNEIESALSVDFKGKQVGLTWRAYIKKMEYFLSQNKFLGKKKHL